MVYFNSPDLLGVFVLVLVVMLSWMYMCVQIHTDVHMGFIRCICVLMLHSHTYTVVFSCALLQACIHVCACICVHVWVFDCECVVVFRCVFVCVRCVVCVHMQLCDCDCVCATPARATHAHTHIHAHMCNCSCVSDPASTQGDWYRLPAALFCCVFLQGLFWAQCMHASFYASTPLQSSMRVSAHDYPIWVGGHPTPLLVLREGWQPKWGKISAPDAPKWCWDTSIVHHHTTEHPQHTATSNGIVATPHQIVCIVLAASSLGHPALRALSAYGWIVQLRSVQACSPLPTSKRSSGMASCVACNPVTYISVRKH